MSSKFKLLLLAFLLSMSILSAVNAQIVQRFDSLARVHQSQGFNGNVLYSKNDSIMFSGNYGVKDFESNTPLNDATLFGLASCTKQFTALAIIQLEEKGLLDYDIKVKEIIADFPYPEVTIEHLLRHQAGLPDYQKMFYWRLSSVTL